MESIYTRTTRTTGLLAATIATALMLGTGVALANDVPCEGGTGGLSVPCAGDDPSTRPSEGDDVFFGSEFRDFMDGRGGNDTGIGNGEADKMEGGEGSDTMEGGAGGDSMNGGPDDDFFYGGEGNDRWSVGDEGDDTLEGNAGGDWLSGDEGNDTVYGNEDDDYLTGDAGADLIDGGAGNDQVSDYSDDTATDNSNNRIFGGAGNDRISAANHRPNVIHGGDGSDDSVDGKDTISGGSSYDKISGGQGYDEIAGSFGDDIMHGDGGDDVLGGTHSVDDFKDPGLDEFLGGDGDDIILAKDSENDPRIDCGPGTKDIVEVDYKLGEWLDNVGCEIIADGVGPKISSWGPSPSTNDATPRVQANIKDSHPRMKLKQSNIKLYVDGRQATTFAYDPNRGLLTHTPQRDLSRGKHTVKVVAKDTEGLTTTKTWSFSVVR